jgi:hypothetical protein
MKPAAKRELEVDQVTLDLFTSEGAPSELEPHAMPASPLACPAQEGATQRYRMPLWRKFQRPEKTP